MVTLLMLMLASVGECIPDLPRTMYEDDIKIEFTVALSDEGQCVQHGLWEETHPNGQLRRSGTYKLGKECGEWTWWTKEGHVKLKGVYDCATGQENGLWTYYYSSGKVYMRGYYKAGLQEGKWEGFHKNGKPMFIANWLSGKLNGQHTVFYDNGQKASEGTRMMDKRVGLWTDWDRDGNIRSQRNIPFQ